MKEYLATIQDSLPSGLVLMPMLGPLSTLWIYLQLDGKNRLDFRNGRFEKNGKTQKL
jgi:hypothetical protein